MLNSVSAIVPRIVVNSDRDAYAAALAPEYHASEPQQFQQSQGLEAEMASIIGQSRNASIVARYFGLDGRGGASLQEVGTELGITRERVRQIVDMVVDRMNPARHATPWLDKALLHAADLSPVRGAALEQNLVCNGITQKPFRVEGLLRAAALFGRKPLFSLLKGDEAVIVRTTDRPAFASVVRLARSLVSRWGMTTVSEVAKRSRTSRRNPLFTTRALFCLNDFCWLDQDRGWFWLTENRQNRIVTRIRKILCVTNPIAIEEFRHGLARSYRKHGFDPPDAVVTELCLRISWLTVEGDELRMSQPTRAGESLSPTERRIFQLFSENGGTMTRADLRTLSAPLKINQSTLYQQLTNAPFLVRQGHTYALIGRSK